MKINYSINFTTPKRSKKKIKFIIIHYTGMKKENAAIKKLCDEKANVSAHYFIKKNGETINLVPDLYKAWHAGKSSWKKKNNLNKSSIGIEIHNRGHQHGYEKFTSKQINSFLLILRVLHSSLNFLSSSAIEEIFLLFVFLNLGTINPLGVSTAIPI